MKTEDLLYADWRKEETRRMIHKALGTIKPLAKFEGKRIPLEKLEKALHMFCTKYEVSVQYIMFLHQKDNYMLSMSIKRSDTNEWMGSVHACCLEESVAKMIIKIYAGIKNGTIPKRKEK